MKPNILFIVWDAVRYDHLSYNGYERQTTPFLESIAGELVHFENAITSASWTLPSHVSMFTGLYPSEHGMVRSSDYLPTNAPILAEILSKAGYQTAGFSQNIFIGKKAGLDRGFDTFLGDRQLRDISIYKRGLPLRAVAKVLRSLKVVSDEWGHMWASARTVNAVQNWLVESWQPRFPFFIFINFMDAHWPMHPPPQFRGRGAVSRTAKKDDFSMYTAIAPEISSDQIQEWLSLYDASIAYLDFQLERLFGFLFSRKLLDDTAVVIVSDHGENYGEHGLFGHVLCIYDTLIHVPLLVRFPDPRLQGIVYQPQVSIVDLFPTILELAQINGAHPHQGRSLIQQIAQPDEQRCVFAERCAIQSNHLQQLLDLNPQYDASWLLQAQKCIRTPHYKYIWSDSNQHELYDLYVDPQEQHNLVNADVPEKEELRSRLETWMSQVEAQMVPETRTEDDEAVIKRLAELGYLD